jgi:membrane-associated PAP2 superfamily phosphatase
MHQSALRITDSVQPTRLSIWREPEEVLVESGRTTFSRQVLLTTILPLAGLLLFTLAVRLTSIDLQISRLFYDSSAATWRFRFSQPWMALYQYGPLPGLFLGLAGVVVAVASYFRAELASWRRAGLFVALLLAIGPGLAVNGILKPQWSRPRPAQVRDFGGQQPFVGVWGFGHSALSKSFPSGHASIGFYLMAPAFLLYPRRQKLAAAFLLLGLACGGLIGLARIAQGQHFLSDVVWAGGLVYFCGLLLGYVFHRLSPVESTDSAAGPVILPMDAARQGRMQGKSASRHEASRRAA